MRGDAAWRARGHAPGMPTACLIGGNNLIFQKTLIFRKSLQICGQGMQPRARHAAKAKAKAAKAKACSPPWACSSQGQGMLACMQQPRPRQPPMGMQQPWQPHGQAAKAKARSQGHGMLAWARWDAPRCRQQGPWGQAAKALACTLPDGAMACPVGGMPRPWHALGTPRRPWQHLGGLLLPCLDNLFGHLLLFPP